MKKIIIVDDERTILLSLSHLLRAEGVEITVCDEMVLAEKALASTRFDLAIADIRMSGVHGREGLELLKFIKERYPTEVIIMTGDDSEEIEALSYELGARHFFRKPVDVQELLATVNEIGIPVETISGRGFSI